MSLEASRYGGHLHNLSGKNVMITGACGFLGRHFVNALVGLDCHVYAVDNTEAMHKMESELPELHGVDFIDCDVSESFTFTDELDAIIHLAGIASPVWYKRYPLDTIRVNTAGTEHMLQLAHRTGATMLYTSSSEIYGDPDVVPTPESYRGNVSCRGERACYDESKRMAETLCWVYWKQFGVDVRVVRPFNVFGPGLRQADYRVLPKFATQIVRGERIQVFGKGTQTRTFCYVDDFVDGSLRATSLGRPGEVYNIGNDVGEINMMELALKLELIAGRDMEVHSPEWVSPPAEYADEPMRRCPDLRKARTELDYTPKVQLHDGLMRFWKWAKEAYK